MTKKIHDILLDRFGSDAIIKFEETIDPYIHVSYDLIGPICMYLRYNPELKFAFLQNISGVDYPDRETITIVYHLFSMKLNSKTVLKVSISRQTPEIETIESVWKAAGWFEREIFDLLGVVFLGHSNLKRLLLPEDWKGHPLRKDYKEEPVYHDMETTRESLLKT